MEPHCDGAGAVLIHPLTGETVSPEDVDALADAWEQADGQFRQLAAYRAQLAAALFALAHPGDGRTCRVRGERRRVRLTLPEDAWDQAKLREAYHAYPQFRDEYLAIERLRVKARNLAKSEHETGPPAFETFLTMVRAANRGPVGTPHVAIEE
jgi:hypothetical protein